MGRPSTYTPELGALICERIANGETLVGICQDGEMPGRQTVYEWMAAHEDFRTRCARAREAQAEFMDHRILGVADAVENRALDPQAAKVVLSALQWRAAKLAPKVYGERQTLEHEGAVGTYVLRAPEPAKDASEWLKSSGLHSPAHKPTS